MARRGPQPIKNVISELMARQGLGSQLAAEARQEAWQEVVGPQMAAYTRCGRIYRQRLEVIVANSTMIQELTFQKQEIVSRLQELAPEMNIRDIRFRVGSLGQ